MFQKVRKNIDRKTKINGYNAVYGSMDKDNTKSVFVQLGFWTKVNEGSDLIEIIKRMKVKTKKKVYKNLDLFDNIDRNIESIVIIQYPDRVASLTTQSKGLSKAFCFINCELNLFFKPNFEFNAENDIKMKKLMGDVIDIFVREEEWEIRCKRKI